MMEKILQMLQRGVFATPTAFVAALHVLVLAVAMVAQPPVEFGANRALP